MMPNPQNTQAVGPVAAAAPPAKAVPPPDELIPPGGGIGLFLSVLVGGLVGGGLFALHSFAPDLPAWAVDALSPLPCVLHGVTAALLAYLAVQFLALWSRRARLENQKTLRCLLDQVRGRMGLRQTSSMLAEGVSQQEREWRDRMDERWVLVLVVGWLIGLGWVVVAATAHTRPLDLDGLTSRLLIGLAEVGTIFALVPVLWWGWRRTLHRWARKTCDLIASLEPVAEVPMAEAAPSPEAAMPPPAVPATTPASGPPNTGRRREPIYRDYKSS